MNINYRDKYNKKLKMYYSIVHSVPLNSTKKNIQYYIIKNDE